jgi:hypothetical protein
MASHDEWVLHPDAGMTGGQLHELFERHVQSPCPSTEVLSEIAEHDHTPFDVLDQLSRPRWRATHRALSTNPNLPLRLVRRLARSDDFDVIDYLARHPAMPLAELRRLARRGSTPAIRRLAQERLAARTTG